ncbi:hypothetical protein EJF36_14805 [Bacillus sp. HMF5848]|uniref:LiaI-LiaF-like domain-containing protein n=1 Tax=Bacillus sp. HMF5848 TaxID=2495421 RepID=UPI000F766B3B|nr:DUF5668 domain-containing protein [Bacillus sp. HMF5848]RSK28046.1 hypothetical protein EJF36_14805 [Bacillus sp. HMF5848]
MKKHVVYTGILLVGIGVFLLLQQFATPIPKEFLSWPTILIIIGFAFLVQAYKVNEVPMLIPGYILIGLGSYFILDNYIPYLASNRSGVILIIVGISLFLKYTKTKSGLSHALLTLAIAAIFFFYKEIFSIFDTLGNTLTNIWRFWPALLVVIGLSLLFRKKR